MGDKDTSALFGYQSDLAKWLFASLLLINVGAMAAIFHEDRIPIQAAIAAAPWFAAGIGLTMVSGYFSWWNTAKHVSLAELKTEGGNAASAKKWIVALAVSSVGFGLAALVMAAIGGLEIARYISSHPLASVSKSAPR